MNREIFRYTIAGGLAFLIDFSVLYLCTEFLAVHYLLSNLLGLVAGLTLTYVLNTQWVFSYRRYKRRTTLEFTIFSAIVVAGLGLNEALMLLLVSAFSLHYLYAKIVTTVFVTIFNYFAKKFILFHPASVPASRFGEFADD
jgi:putative flippase GtrA